MPTLSDTAIVLRQWDYSETSQTVRLLTREHGTLRGLGKGARRERGMFSGGFEVCTRGHLVALVKPGRDLSTLTEWRLLEVFPGVRRRLTGNRVALLAADLVAHLLNDGDPHPEVFDALAHLLRRLDRGEAWPALLAFQWRLLDATGYAPRLDHDVLTDAPLDPDADVLAFRPDAGGFTADPHATGAADAWRLRWSTLEALRSVADAAEPGTGDRGSGADDPNDPSRPHDRNDPQDPETDPAGGSDATTAAKRANRLLATYARHVVGREVPALEWAFRTS